MIIIFLTIFKSYSNFYIDSFMIIIHYKINLFKIIFIKLNDRKKKTYINL